MANTDLFETRPGVPATDTVNEAGGRAYRMNAEHALAQLAATGCFQNTFYTSAQDQLKTVLALTEQVAPHFIAQTAVFAREKGFMKDMPALLCAVLATRDPDLLVSTFARVIDNGRMVRNFVQMIRSGVTGRRSLGSRPKRLVRTWLAERDGEALVRDSVGNQPSLGDIIKMVHPVPTSPAREALYGYLIGREVDQSLLPESLQDFERYKQHRAGVVPKVPFQMLTALDLDRDAWTEIARNASWTMTRMNLNTFHRHGVFEVKGMPELIAKRLANADLIRTSRVFPYQLLAAYLNVEPGIPRVIADALEHAMEISIDNVPRFEGRVAVLPDISGSMGSPVTGYRHGATTKVKCVHVAALVAAAVLRRNPDAVVLPFDTRVVTLKLRGRDSVLTNARKLAISGGGTDCSAPLRYMLHKDIRVDTAIFVSDNESWFNGSHRHSYYQTTATAAMEAWNRYRTRNRGARLVCLDIQPNTTVQATGSADILNLGGFSDQSFTMIDGFVRGKGAQDYWVRQIKKIEV
ncbi:TROVE domain-containing protein [Acanthopleuribacter pedis]|uniref:TROVE domain-containing protein n=1 Tax=Acanthopleuribacter pedis TaxID=442870 RepID=A0A8J7U6V4_9BACT|nr:TROVE domain-containing protein [Acanthopleuribacter pedis]MBO1320766.1 TROVE domain-containing protein [Acanthopleuribacter pedis]